MMSTLAEPVSEHEIVRRMKEGQESAFSRFISLYHKDIYRIAYSFLMNHEDAMDLSQDVFIKVFSRVKEIKPETVKSWLYAITRNLALNMIRSKKREKARIEKSSHAVSTPQHSDVMENIGKLEEPHKSILIAKFASGLSNSECSEALNIKRDQFSVYLSRAIEVFRKEYKK